MSSARAVRIERVVCLLTLTAALHLIDSRNARGSTFEYLPVSDPLEDELRILDALGPVDRARPLRLPRLAMRPLQRFELDSLPAYDAVRDPARRISLLRIQRVLARERDDRAPGDPPGCTPRLYHQGSPGGARFEISAGVEGGVEFGDHRPQYPSGSGIRSRIALESDRWLAFTNMSIGHIDSARTFADPLIPNHDVILFTEETYLGYTGTGGRWAVQLGRSRWHWGPGEEGSLLLSKTSAPLTGLAMHARLEALHADGSAISATLRETAGEHLAAHRLEWQPFDCLRLGVSEAARYHSPAWQPLYLVGVIPYILVQRIVDQDEPAAAGANRNNVMIGMDAAVRVAPGTRLYGEWLADDIHLINKADLPSKYAYQLGWEGVGTIRNTRVSWGGEYTRVTRYVYTSFFGRDFVAQNRPLGFPFAPDARRIRVRVRCDLSTAWQLLAKVSHTDKGENTVHEPFVPGVSPIETSPFQGIVETTREAEAGVRWWPAGGVDATLTLGYRWIDDEGHVSGARENASYGTFALRLVR